MLISMRPRWQPCLLILIGRLVDYVAVLAAARASPSHVDMRQNDGRNSSGSIGGHDGATSWGGRIKGGIRAQPHEFPFLVLFDRSCGGTVIDEHYILTAAHCIGPKLIEQARLRPSKPKRELRVKVGAHNIATQGLDMPIELVAVHRKYARRKGAADFDIALLRTKQPMAIDSAPQSWGIVRKIELPERSDIDDDYRPGEMATISGWGIFKYDGEIAYLPSELRKAELPVVAIDLCQLEMPLGDEMARERKICAGYYDGSKDSCSGDSGGPLFRRHRRGHFELIGITSYGPSCTLSRGYGVYTRIASYDLWIRECKLLMNTISHQTKHSERELIDADYDYSDDLEETDE